MCADSSRVCTARSMERLQIVGFLMSESIQEKMIFSCVWARKASMENLQIWSPCLQVVSGLRRGGHLFYLGMLCLDPHATCLKLMLRPFVCRRPHLGERAFRRLAVVAPQNLNSESLKRQALSQATLAFSSWIIGVDLVLAEHRETFAHIALTLPVLKGNFRMVVPFAYICMGAHANSHFVQTIDRYRLLSGMSNMVSWSEDVCCIRWMPMPIVSSQSCQRGPTKANIGFV